VCADGFVFTLIYTKKEADLELNIVHFRILSHCIVYSNLNVLVVSVAVELADCPAE
jgi:hypothetical protein